MICPEKVTQDPRGLTGLRAGARLVSMLLAVSWDGKVWGKEEVTYPACGRLGTKSFPSVILLFTHSVTLLGQDITVLFVL